MFVALQLTTYNLQLTTYNLQLGWDITSDEVQNMAYGPKFDEDTEFVGFKRKREKELTRY